MEDMEELEEMDDGLDDDERFLDRLRDNAYARDFTLNGLLYDVQSGELYDFVNGIDDIRNQVVRSITPANEAFQEDPARMVRAIRVAARHDFRPAPDLVSAIRANARLVRAEPPARMAAELLTVLSCGYAARAVRVLWECGLLEHLMREHASYIARAVGDPTKSLVVAVVVARRVDAVDRRRGERDDDDAGRVRPDVARVDVARPLHDAPAAFRDVGEVAVGRPGRRRHRRHARRRRRDVEGGCEPARVRAPRPEDRDAQDG